jgi:hypothetical protein
VCLMLLQRSAGSTGDPHAPQLIVENRSVTLEYARPDERRVNDRDRPRDEKRGGVKSDWLCEAVSHFVRFLSLSLSLSLFRSLALSHFERC